MPSGDIALIETARSFGTDAFAATLQREIAALPEGSLPLAGLQGGWLESNSIAVMLLSCRADPEVIEATIGVFFREIVGGCSCGEERFTSDGYRELGLRIDRSSGGAVFIGRDAH